MRRGYAGVTLLDVADDLRIKQASLYYHAPGGKIDLFEQVVRYALHRHKRGFARAIGNAPDTARGKLERIIDWLVTQPPMPLVRILYDDLVHLPDNKREELANLAQISLYDPIRETFAAAIERGEIHEYDPDLLTRALLSVMTDVVSRPQNTDTSRDPRKTVSHQFLDVMFDGLKVA